MIDNYDFTQLIVPLQDWFKSNARVLPWREKPCAYYVWVSEIMLQQTRVEAVKPYFDRFVRKLPDVKALAECSEDNLLKLWEGLGYYNRVRNLNIAAKQVMEDYGGVIPSDYEELLKLKGIGSYTAGAIASIAYGKAHPAVDGNVLRVISRVTADDSDIMKQSVRTRMEERLRELMEASEFLQPAVFNQALMELGALVCVPNGEPHCESCPWNALCEARKQGQIDRIPVKTKAKKRRIEEKTVIIVKDGERLALHKRADSGLLAGLYELPNLEGHLSEAEVLDYVKMRNLTPLRILPLADAKHIFSHVEWHMKGYAVFVAADSKGLISKEAVSLNREDGEANPWIYVDVEETTARYAIPSAFSKYAKYLNLTLGKDAILQ